MAFVVYFSFLLVVRQPLDQVLTNTKHALLSFQL